MANEWKISNTAASAAADAVVDLLDSGKLRIYDGTKPATADTAISPQTLLAELTFGATAFGAASNGVATANAITADSSANATGTAAWFRVTKSDGTTVIGDGTVDTDWPLEDWRRYRFGDPEFDPSLWVIAWDGDEIAGYSMNRYRTCIGWIRTLGVRPPWRKRGLGEALLHHSFGEYYRRGMKTIGLGVNANNPSGNAVISKGRYASRQRACDV